LKAIKIFISIEKYYVHQYLCKRPRRTLTSIPLAARSCVEILPGVLERALTAKLFLTAMNNSTTLPPSKINLPELIMLVALSAKRY